MSTHDEAQRAQSRESILPNLQEIAYWNDEAGSRWARFQERIDRAFAPLSAAGLAAAAVQPGEAILDIGCGCGATSLELCDGTREGGSVVGIDVSRSMLDVARERAGARSLINIRFLLADASTEAFREHIFDLVFSRFGVMFFDDSVAAFANVRKSFTVRRQTRFRVLARTRREPVVCGPARSRPATRASTTETGSRCARAARVR